MVDEGRTEAAADEATFRLFDAMNNAEEAEDPTFEGVGTVLQKPSNENPMAAVISEISGPGWVYLYNTMTHEKVKVNKWNLQQALKKRHNDPTHPDFMGKPLFSTQKTGDRQYGQFHCYLYGGSDDKKCEACGKVHTKHPMYDQCMDWGMKKCLGAHIPSPFEVRRHMERRHKIEWGAIKEYEDTKRNETYEQQRIAEVKRNQDILEMLAAGKNSEDVVKRGRPPKETE